MVLPLLVVSNLDRGLVGRKQWKIGLLPRRGWELSVGRGPLTLIVCWLAENNGRVGCYLLSGLLTAWASLSHEDKHMRAGEGREVGVDDDLHGS